MFAQVLADWPTFITALLLSITAVVGILNLWYNVLAGPRIKLVKPPDLKPPDFNLHDVPADAPAIPMSVELGLRFVFINNGSTKGMVKLQLAFFSFSRAGKIGLLQPIYCSIRKRRKRAN
jgi:hypothetical protein